MEPIRALRNPRHGATLKRPPRTRTKLDWRWIGLGAVVIGPIAMLVIVVMNWSQITQFLNRPVSTLRVDNEVQFVTEPELRALIAPAIGQGFFSVDVGLIKALLESHPWVAQASVQRHWPDMLSLQVVEEIAIARWGDQGVLNQRAEIITPADTQALQALPRLTGPLGSQTEVMQRFSAINELFFPTGLRMTALTLSGRGSWQLTVNDSFEVIVGRRDVNQRLQRFLDLFGAQPSLQSAAIRQVDLRYDNGVAVAYENDNLAEVAVR